MKAPDQKDGFDELLDGEAPAMDALRATSEQMRTERTAARASIGQAAAHIRQRTARSIRAAHEKTQGVEASVRSRVPAVAARVRQELAATVRWKIIAPLLGVSAVVAVAALALLLGWNVDPSSPNELNATSPASYLPVPTPDASSKPAEGAQDLARTAAALPAPAAPLGESQEPAAIAVSPAPVAPSAPAPASSVLPELPPAPTNPTPQNCIAAVPLMNGLFGSAAHTRTANEIAWAAFGYRCAQSGALTYSGAGYAPKSEGPTPARKAENPRTPSAKPRVDKPTATRAPAAEPSGETVARIPGAVQRPRAAAAATQASPVGTPATCVLRGVVSTEDGKPMPNAPVQISSLERGHYQQRVSTDPSGRFSADVPTGMRLRVELRARGYLDDGRETLNCAPVRLVGARSNPVSSLFDAARRVDRSIKGRIGGR